MTFASLMNRSTSDPTRTGGHRGWSIRQRSSGQQSFRQRSLRQQFWRAPRSFLLPVLLVPVVLLIDGYHPFAGDAGIYAAGIRHILNPALYPVNAVFVTAFDRFSVFGWLVAALVRTLHASLTWTLFAIHLFSIFLFLVACRHLASRMFDSELSRIGSVLLAAACFSLPVAGTALVLMDPYVTARSFSTPLSLLAIAACIDRAWLRAILLLGLAAFLHPLMGAYSAGFVILLALVCFGRVRWAVVLCVAVVAAAAAAFATAHGVPVSAAYRQAVSLAPRSFLFVARWHWYEIVGMIVPLLLYGIALLRFRRFTRIGSVCLTCILLGSTSVVIAALFVPPTGPYLLVPLQVLRSFHVIYAVGVVLCGGVLGVLMKRRRPAALGVAVLVFAAMFAAQRATWPDCDSVEWPGLPPANPYEQAFLWIRGHTAADAVFAFDPQLVYRSGEDEQGFRAISERDQLADDKDAGVVAVIPHLADRWARQRNAEFSVDRMTDGERRAILCPLGANWLLLAPHAQTGLSCPYRNEVVKACRLTP